MATVDTSQTPPAPRGARAVVERVANAFGTFDVTADGTDVQVGRSGRTAEVVIKQLPERAAAEATFDRLAALERRTETQEQALEDATVALQQIVATESLIAATLYHEVLAPERDGGPGLAQKLAQR